MFVLTDDLSTNLLQYMPHVRDMQQRGVTFSNYFVTDSLCCPSRSSILTGRFPHSTGVFTNTAPDGGFPLFYRRGEEKDTFSTTLRSGGYRTALMGKYLNEYNPRHTPGQRGPYVPPGWTEWDATGNGYGEFNYALNENGHVVRYGTAPKAYLTDVIASKGLSFVRGSLNAGSPFLLELATFAPHSPYVPAPRDSGLFPGVQAPRTPAFDASVAGAPAWLAAVPPLDTQAISRIDDAYRKRVQSVQAVDQMLGRIEDELRAAHQLDNTYLVFSSDNGYHMGEHRLRPGKLTAFDTDVRVPLVVVGPGVRAGRTVDQIVENVDLRPTFQELAGSSSGPAVEGRSLVPFLRGQAPPYWRTAALVEHHGPVGGGADEPDHALPFGGNPPTYEAMRTATALYVEYADGEREYYDVVNDPEELTNLAAQLPADQTASLHAALTAMAGCRGGDACWAVQHVSP
ncbi:MAG: arylsulfatase [Acidimicrobiales bacterium]|nr:arylsulfatase [Acidimicrobiales bacterium]